MCQGETDIVLVCEMRSCGMGGRSMNRHGSFHSDSQWFKNRGVKTGDGGASIDKTSNRDVRRNRHTGPGKSLRSRFADAAIEFNQWSGWTDRQCQVWHGNVRSRVKYWTCSIV